MRNKHILNPTRVLLAAALAFLAPVAFGQLKGRALMAASDSDQIAFVKSALDRGLTVEFGGDVSVLVRVHSAVVVPVIEQKIEEVLNSATPAQCFTAKDIDPARFVVEAAATIAYAGDENALRAVTKLLRIDEKQFSRYVALTLWDAYHSGNPMAVAYRGLDLHDSLLERYILSWVTGDLLSSSTVKTFWAEALVDRYGGVPVRYQWEEDPIASRLPKEAAQVHDEMVRLANDVVAKRARK